MDVNLPKLLLDYRLETKKGASRRRVTQVVHDPDLPPFAAPTLESWESSKKILGRGGQGEVLLQKCISGPRCNSMRALKVIRCFDDGARRRHVRELETMVRFSHERYSKSFVKMIGWYFSSSRSDLCIALEYVPYGDLYSFLQERLPFDERDAQYIISQVLHGLAMMHKAGFAHMDIKPQNILIQQHPSSNNPRSPWWVKLADFGISKDTESTFSAVNIGTHDYMAPELFRPPAKAKDIDLKLADLWAVGVTAYYLLTKDKGFRDWRSSDSLKTPSADLWLLPGIQGRRVSADGLAFILKVTMESPDERLRWEETSNHAWVSHYKRMFSAFSVEEDEDDGSFVDSWITNSSLDTTKKPVERGLTTLSTRLTEIPSTAELITLVPQGAPQGDLGIFVNPSDDARRPALLEKKSPNLDEKTIQSILGIEVSLKSPDSNIGRLGRTPLWHAAAQGHEAIVELLLSRGAGIDTKDNNGDTPLLTATHKGQTAIVELLLSRGAEIDAKNNDGVPPLQAAAYGGHKAIVKLLLSRGAEIDLKDNYGSTPLLIAAISGHKAIVKLLLSRGADISVKDNDGNTPLKAAAYSDHWAIVEELKKMSSKTSRR